MCFKQKGFVYKVNRSRHARAHLQLDMSQFTGFFVISIINSSGLLYIIDTLHILSWFLEGDMSIKL